jgi:hypothetical protein
MNKQLFTNSVEEALKDRWLSNAETKFDLFRGILLQKLLLLGIFFALGAQSVFAQPATPVGLVANPASGSGQVFLAVGPNQVGSGNVVYRLFYSPSASAPANPLTATQYTFGTTAGDGGGTSAFGFNISGLTPSTSYTFWLYQYNTVTMQYSTGNSSAVRISGAALAAVPPTPVGLDARITSPTAGPGQVFLAVGPNNVGSGNVVYRLFYSPTASAPANPLMATQYPFGTTAGDGGGTSAFGFLLSGLTPSTSYTFWLYQYNTVTAMYSTGNASDVQVSGAAPAPVGTPTVAAPTPLCGQANVISLFSNAYTNVPVDTWLTPWSAAPVTLTDVMIAGNATKFYQDVTFLGIETVSNQINATNMTTFHIDFWSGNATQFRIKLVDAGPNGALGGGDDKEHELTFANPAQNTWVSYDLPLSSFTGLTTRANLVQYILSAMPNGQADFYIDNMYFANSMCVTAAPVPTCAAANVISLFSNSYTNVPVNTFLTPWSQAPVTLTNVQISGNDAKFYQDVTFLGIETVSNPVNATAMTTFHIDFWSGNATQFRVKLVDAGPNGVLGGGDDKEHEITFSNPAQNTWISYQIPLSSFTGLTTRANLVQYILSAMPNTVADFYIDNMYFSTCVATTPITLCVNMGCLGGVQAPSVAGVFNGFNFGANPLTLTTNGIYCATVQMTPGAQEYKFFDQLQGQEEFAPGAPCTVTTGPFTNRVINVVAGLPQTVTFGWESCTATCVPPPAKPALKITFEDPATTTNYNLVDFGGANSSIVADPTNAANKVVRVIKLNGAAVFAGTILGNAGLIAPIPFTATNQTMTARIWAPAAGIPVLLKLENAAGGPVVEVFATTTTAGWQYLNWNMGTSTNQPFNVANTYNKIVIFFDFGSIGTNQTFFIDDVAFCAVLPGAPVAPATQTFCNSPVRTVANLVAAGNGIRWFSSATTRNALAPTTALANGTYYVSQIDVCGCESPRTAVTVSVIACQVSISDPCGCKNNATTLTNGQFTETVTVNAPAGQTWTVSAINGLFSAASANPPAAPTPIAIGTVLTAAGGVYTLSGIHVDAIGYTLSVTNGLTTLSVGATCVYPNPVLSIDDSRVYCAGSPAIPLTGISGDASSIESFTINGVAATQFSAANLGVGNHTVVYSVNGGVPKATGATDPGCVASVSKVVTVVATNSVLTCNNLVNISLDQTCVAAIKPEQILQGTYSCFDDYSVNITGLSGTPNIGSTLNSAHINKTWRATVTHTPSGNKCWGNIFVEDKSAPTVTCTDITVNCNQGIPAFPPNTGNATVIVSDNCGAHTLTSADVESVDVSCTGTINGQAGMSYAVKRIHSATDATGNVSAPCTQWIYFRRVAITPAVLAASIPVDVTLSGCNANTSPSVTGTPSIGGGFCEANVVFTDAVIPVCDGTRKIVRTWTIVDWCAPTGTFPFVATQIIKVQDVTGPTFITPLADVTISTETNSCTGNYNLPDVIVDDACSRLASIKAQYSINGTPFVVNGSFPCYGCPVNPTPGCGWPAPYTNSNNCWATDTLGVLGTINNLPIGTHEITYVITDDCGNSTTLLFKVTVADLVPPTAVCDKNTVASIGQDGTAFINATTFDDGSYDNCNPVFFKARRMDAGCGQNIDFHDQVKFCCADIGTVVTVVFRAYDVNPGTGDVSQSFLSDRSNDCMVQVEVSDKLRPTCSAPANVTVSCKTFDPSYWSYGTATATDNCALDTITVSVDASGFDQSCNRGIVRRTWTAKDKGGLESRCTQTITVTYDQDYFLHFPADVKVTQCTGTGNYGEPTIFRKDCELTAVTFHDDTLKLVPDACYKILRHWKVINWCTFNTNGTVQVVPNPLGDNGIVKVTPYPSITTGIHADSISTSATTLAGGSAVDYSSFWSASQNCYEYTQIISIIDSQKPTIDGTAADQTLNDITDNSPMWYANPNFNDPVLNVHDLCEGQPDLNITASDLCTGTNLTVRYILFLDTDGDGTMETVVNSFSVPEPGFLNIGNAFNANYAGGNPIQIDLGENFQPIPGRTFGNPIRNFRYKFDVATTVAGGKRTARVVMNTIANSAPVIAPQLPYGRHKIKWLVADNCGNEETREYFFSIRDDKAPTVVCAPIAVNIMPTQMIDIWDTELLQYTTDNCTPTAQLETAICRGCTSFPVDANNQPIKSVRFTCADLGTQPVRIWSRDKSTPRNADYCETTVLVQDNIANACPNNGNKNDVVGATKGTNNFNATVGADDVQVTLNVSGLPSGVGAFNETITTNNAGLYTFANAVPMLGNITVTPVKDIDQLNGVDMLDVLKVQRHILGLEPLSSNYRQIAADVNNSRSITANDIVEMRKVILGASPKFVGVASWRFVPHAFTFANANNPFTAVFPESATYALVSSDMLDVNFEAIKSGDVTGNATFNSVQAVDDRSAGTLYFDAAQASVAAGEEFTVNFKGSAAAEAVQFTMNLNGLEVVSTDLAEGTFAIHSGAMTVATDANAFAVTFRAAKAGALNNMISATSKITKAAAFAGTERYDVAFRFNGLVAGAGFELMQNVPNPVKNVTAISFNLPEAVTATLTFTNVEGRVIKVVTGDFAKGLNTVTMNRSELAAGVIFYQLDTPTHSDVKKMIIVE